MTKKRGKASVRGCELLADVEAHTTQDALGELLNAGLPKDQAEAIAKAIGHNIANTLRNTWAGQLVYIPFDKERRNAQIYKKFTGNNHDELAKEFHTSTRNIYKIISRERSKRTHKQLTFF